MSADIERQVREALAERQAGFHPSTAAPEGFLRRARRRVARNVVLGVVIAALVVAGSVGAIRELAGRGSDRVPVGEGDRRALPTQGPTPGETSLVIASGEQDGE